MTYGDNARELRESMTWLLGKHRILDHLGAPDEQAALGELILGCRLATTTWCLQAVTIASPKMSLVGTTSWTRGPVEELRFRLAATIDAAPEASRPTDLFATQHHRDLPRVWQRAARAAVLLEHDLAAGMDWGRLPADQIRTVLKDACDTTRALVILDERYHDLPGWQRFTEPNRLGRAAEVCSVYAGWEARDHAVDQRGWRPAQGTIEGPALPGVAGAVRAQHNVLVDLTRFPNALNLRRILHSQAQVSREAAKHAATAAPDLVDSFTERAELYREIVRASRDVGGLIGEGGYAVAQSQIATSRLQRTPAESPETGQSLHELARLFPRTDARIAAIIEHGFNEKLYFVAVNDPRLMDKQVRGVHPSAQRWVPVTSPDQTPLLGLVREQLRPPPLALTARPEAQTGRAAYEEMVSREVARVGNARQPT